MKAFSRYLQTPHIREAYNIGIKVIEEREIDDVNKNNVLKSIQSLEELCIESLSIHKNNHHYEELLLQKDKEIKELKDQLIALQMKEDDPPVTEALEVEFDFPEVTVNENVTEFTETLTDDEISQNPAYKKLKNKLGKRYSIRSDIIHVKQDSRKILKLIDAAIKIGKLKYDDKETYDENLRAIRSAETINNKWVGIELVSLDILTIFEYKNFFGGGWFEFLVLHEVFEGAKKANISIDVLMNVSITDNKNNMKTLTEFDIVIISNDKVGIIECKSGLLTPSDINRKKEALQKLLISRKRYIICPTNYDKKLTTYLGFPVLSFSNLKEKLGAWL